MEEHDNNIDKSDSEDQSVVESSRNMFKQILYQKDDRDREVAKAEQEKEKQRAHKAAIQKEQKEIERSVIQQKEFQQNKKPRTEELEDKQHTNN
eukprot:7470659-Heterocapsa_arctica.AAC.1